LPDFKKWPLQREPSPIAGQTYPTQQPIVGVFGQEGFGEQTPVNAPAVVMQQKVITEQTQLQELPEHHRDPVTEDVEILAAEMLLKANRSPTDWKPITYTFDGENPQQIGRMVGRKTIVFFNGSNPAVIGRTVNSVTGVSNENFTLTNPDSASIDTEGEFWIMMFNSGDTLSVVQTFWDLGAMVVAKRRTKNANGFKHSAGWSGIKSSSSAN
jgi:hypothetical protein